MNSQTYRRFDLIILVDGVVSEKLKDIIKNTPNTNTVVFEYKINRGLAFVLNDGIRYCLKNHYQFIGRMDADDISLPYRLEKQIKFLEKNPQTDVVN